MSMYDVYGNGKRQKIILICSFSLYSFNQSSRKIGKNLLFTVIENIFTLLYKRFKIDARKLNFCRLPFGVNVMLKPSIRLPVRLQLQRMVQLGAHIFRR